MSTYRELVYMVMDKLKLNVDDTLFTEDHIMFLLDKYRDFLLKQGNKADSTVADSNYQTLCIPLVEVPSIIGEPCEGQTYLRSKDKLPSLLGVGITSVYPPDYLGSIHIIFVDERRFRFTGENKYMKNIIYVTLFDNYLYLKSQNPQYLYLKDVKMKAVFEDPKEAAKLACEPTCDNLDSKFPLSEDKIPLLLEYVVKDLAPALTQPEDKQNDAQDETSTKATGQ